MFNRFECLIGRNQENSYNSYVLGMCVELHNDISPRPCIHGLQQLLADLLLQYLLYLTCWNGASKLTIKIVNQAENILPF